MALAIKDNNALYLSNFQLFEKSLNGEAKSWLHPLRKEALARFDQLGFPTTRHEEWKYTNISAIAKEHFSPVLQPDFTAVSEGDIARYNYGGLDAHLLVFIDGLFAAERSSVGTLPEGVRLSSLAEALRADSDMIQHHLAKYAEYREDPFAALNTAFVYDGTFLHIPANTVMDKPIHLLYLSTQQSQPFITHPRNLVIADANSRGQIIETYAGQKNGTYLTNSVTEFIVGESSFLEHVKIQEESLAAYHISTSVAYQRANSNFSSHSISFGGKIVRNNPTAILDAEGVESTLNGLYLGTGSQLIDNHTVIDHAKPHCNSHELYKGVLDGNARGVFNGKIFVRLDAQKTDAKQTNKALLLSDEATIDTKPQLEIFADDVKCTHGATIGQLDENAMFYLQARGIAKDMARDILTYAFASDVIDRVEIKELRDYCHHRVLTKLSQDRLEGIDQE
jgi:Fe-S cluster assembly protein SufD